MATKAVNSGKVRINDSLCKASREVRDGDSIEAEKGFITFKLEVVDFPKQRLPAKEVDQYLKNHTPDSEYEKAKLMRLQRAPFREKGSGRPTKKDRRAIDKWGFWEEEE